MSIPLSTFNPSVRIFKGDKHCPKTVMIACLDSPDASHANAYISSDKASLDQASSTLDSTTLLPYLTEGFPIINQAAGQDFPSDTFLIIPGCTSDIYIRAVNYVAGTAKEIAGQLFVIAVSSF